MKLGSSIEKPSAVDGRCTYSVAGRCRIALDQRRIDEVPAQHRPQLHAALRAARGLEPDPEDLPGQCTGRVAREIRERVRVRLSDLCRPR